jgi:predicted Rossmann fold flavoprotein
LLTAKQQQGKSRLNTLLNKHLAKALVNELQGLWWPQLPASPLAEFSDKHLQTIGQQLNSWCLKPSASEGYRTAEVTLGGSGIGYDIARQFSLPVTECRAGLVPFMFSDFFKPICERLSGLALEVEVGCRGQAFKESLLFTHRGLSGPVILQISNYWYPGDAISINLLPELDATQWLLTAKQQQGKSRLNTLLNKHLAKALVNELQGLWWPQLAASPLAEFSDKHLQTIGQQLNGWCLKPSASEGYRTAEVTLGGVDTNSISSKTLEAKQQTGLYFVGEVLDVSGHLGGFNFQWAWSSGYSAGQFV